MPIALVIEDGSSVASANSYATLDQIREYNEAREVDLPEDETSAIAQALMAMDYLGTYEQRFAGRRTFGLLQPLSWPRTGVVAFGTIVGSSLIPQDIIDVQCYIAGQAMNLDLYGNLDSRAIIKETVGPLETDYSPSAGATSGPIMPTVVAKLTPYLRYGAGMLRSVRI